MRDITTDVAGIGALSNSPVTRTSLPRSRGNAHAQCNYQDGAEISADHDRVRPGGAVLRLIRVVPPAD